MTALEYIKDLTRNRQNVFIYLAKHDEMPTDEIISWLMVNNKTVIVPVLRNNRIVPVVLESLDRVITGPYDIREPGEIKQFTQNDIDIYFVPGREFDAQGSRRGRGSGHFDRFLAGISKPIVGLCFERQLVNNLSPKPWDVKMTAVITEKKIYRGRAP